MGRVMAQQLLLSKYRRAHFEVMTPSLEMHNERIPHPALSFPRTKRGTVRNAIMEEADMSKRKSKYLSKHVNLKCFLCHHNKASYVRHLDWDGLNVQLCLCPECVSLGKELLVAKFLHATASKNDRYPANLL